MLYGDVFKIGGTPNSAADEWVAYEFDISNLEELTTYFLVRWKTEFTSSALGARVRLEFTDNSIQYIVGENVPVFNTTWQVASGEVTFPSGESIDKIRFYANDYPDSINSGESYVYYEFLLLHKGTFTLPNTAFGMNVNLPHPRDAIIDIWGRGGDVTQKGGTKLATVDLSCNLDRGNWKRTGDYVPGQVFYEIAHNSDTEIWQWLNTGTEQFKATLEDPVIRHTSDGNKAQRILDLLFREYRLSSAKNESVIERLGLNL